MQRLQGFVRPESRRILVVQNEAAALLAALEEYQAPVSILATLRNEHQQQSYKDP
jgi:hypothetical protein